MSTATVNTRSETPRRELPWARRGEQVLTNNASPVLSVVICCYFSVSLSLLAPFLWELNLPQRAWG